MKPQKTCVCCHDLLLPCAFHSRRQRACSKPECQKQRRRDYNQMYYRKNKSDWDYRWDERKEWQKKKMRLFMRQYRKDHPDYVRKNRRQQFRRNRRKRRLIVNSVVQMPIYPWKLMRIHLLESDCKFRRIRLLPE